MAGLDSHEWVKPFQFSEFIDHAKLRCTCANVCNLCRALAAFSFIVSISAQHFQHYRWLVRDLPKKEKL